MAAHLPLAILDQAMTLGIFPSLSEDALRSASYSVEFAFDPLAISGHEAHRCNVDRSDLTDERLREIDAAAWAVLADRNDARHGVFRTAA